MTRISCTSFGTRRPIALAIGAATVFLGLSAAPVALAVQSPPGCNANTLNLTLSRSTSIAVPGQTVEFGVSVAVPATDGAGVPACDTSLVDITAQCPDAANGVPPSTPVQVLATDQSYPAGTPPTSVGTIECVMPDVATNKAVSAYSAASGLLLDNDILAGSEFTRSNTITVTVTPCQVKVDKQVSCDGGLTWVDPGLVLDNEDGTLDCSVIGLTGPIKVQYQAQNTSASCALTSCVLTESNSTFGTPPAVGSISPGATTDFLPAANSPACSTAYGDPQSPNEPNTVGITCQTGGTPVTASDMASFACLKVDAQVDRQVSCDGGSSFADPGLQRTNEDGTNGCTAVDGEPVNWQYQGCNAGAAPLYDCTLVDQNVTYVSDPIVLGNLAPFGQAGDCSALTPSTKSPQACGDALEASETPDNGTVTMTCCTSNVANISECAEANRVAVYDASTVTCSTPSGLNAVKECVDTNLDGNDDNVRVTASATNGDIGFENCTATDTIYLDDATCPPAGSGTSIPLAREGGGAYPFALAPSGSVSLFGTIDPALDQDACNTASVTCDIVGTGEPVTAIAPEVVCNYEEREGCFTRTPGFWATHPGDDARIGTYDFLPQTVCGVELDTVTAGRTDSAIEAMCSVGTDSKLPGTSPQLTQLIRQCTAASLNIAASVEFGGSCESDYPQLGMMMDSCCGGEESLCTDGYEGSLTIGECIYYLDEFNNSTDTLYPEAFRKPGKANPTYCQGAKNNGVAIIP